MRLALLVMVGCAAQPRIAEPIAEPTAPPLATFRWALGPLACDGEGRSTIDTCEHRENLRESDVVAVYAPTDDTSLLVAIRYEGAIGAPLRWQRRLDVGPEPHSAVVTVARDTAIIAAVSNGAARVVALDNEQGRVLGTQTIVATGARSVQLEAIDDFVRIHVRTASGGVVAVMHPRHARVIAQRAVDERAILEHDLGMPDPVSERDDIALRWEHGRLALRRAQVWMRYLRLAHHPEEQLRFRAMLDQRDELVLVTVHDTETGRVEVSAFARGSGAPAWRSVLTSNPRRMPGAIVRTGVDGDQLLVTGSADRQRFTCSLAITDGVEQACVERLGALDTAGRSP